jgi:hypothetical protein
MPLPAQQLCRHSLAPRRRIEERRVQLTCPCCHAKYPLEAATEEEAAGELQLLLVQAGPLARPLVAYLGLFRAKAGR